MGSLAGALLHPHEGKWVYLDAKVDPGANRSVIPSWAVRAFRNAGKPLPLFAQGLRSADGEPVENHKEVTLANGLKVKCERWLVDICLCSPVPGAANPWMLKQRAGIVQSSWWIRFGVLTNMLSRPPRNADEPVHLDGGCLEMDRPDMLIGTDILRQCATVTYRFKPAARAGGARPSIEFVLDAATPRVTCGTGITRAASQAVPALDWREQILRAPHELKARAEP